MYYDYGDILIDAANDANIPVNIWITLVSKAEQEGNSRLKKWRLEAGNYMPRKGCLSDGKYLVTSDDRDELVEFVQKYWLPLYENAILILKNLGTQGENGTSCLYYWTKEDGK